DSAGHTPFYSGYPAGSADADNGSCDRVRGADRDSAPCCSDDTDRSSGFCAESTYRPERGDLLSHGPHDTPAAGQGAKANGSMRHQYDPEGNVECLEVSGCEQDTCNDPHCLLRVIGAMSETEQRGRKQLQAPKVFVDARWRCSSKYPLQHGHE